MPNLSLTAYITNRIKIDHINDLLILRKTVNIVTFFILHILYTFILLLQENGKPTVTTRVFQRPVTEKELQTVWDEQTLRLLVKISQLRSTLNRLRKA